MPALARSLASLGMTVQVALPSPAAFVTPHAGPHPRRRHDRAARGLPPGGHNPRPGGAVRVHPRALPQAVFRLVGGGVGPLQRPDRRHRQFPPHRRLDLALLAPGGHRVDRARAALCRAGVLPRAPLAALVSRAGALPAGVVVRRHLPSRPLPLGRGAGGPLPQPRHPVDRLGVPALPAAGPLQRRDAARIRLPPLGPSPPGLPVPARPRRLESLGLLHRHPAHPRRRHRHPAPRARRPAPRPRGAERSLG